MIIVRFILACLLILLCIIIYFLPAIIARNSKNATTILLCNIFLGWTGAGWLFCLIWAISAD